MVPAQANVPGGVAWEDFFDAVGAVLTHLRETAGFGDWIVTRVSGNQQVVLGAAGGAYAITAGERLDWDATPPSAINRRPAVTALGVPLGAEGDPRLGWLWVLDREPRTDELAAMQPLMRLQSKLLGFLLAADLALDSERRRAQRAELEALVDPLTALPNRRAWSTFLPREEQRCQRYGHPATLVVLDLDGLKATNDAHGHAAGDALLRAAADALRLTARASDFAARLGGDEFGLLLVETSGDDAAMIVKRVQEALDARGVPASIGAVGRPPAEKLQSAWVQADHAMYAAKRRRAAMRAEPSPG